MLPPVRHSTRRPAAAFTLIEVLIVVVLLGILAAIVIPQLTSATEESRSASLTTNLRRIRLQMEIYRQEHGAYPTDASTFAAQMTQASNQLGQTAAPGTEGYPYGPYISAIPRNPVTQGNTISDGEVGTSDWYYADGQFCANDSVDSRTY